MKEHHQRDDRREKHDIFNTRTHETDISIHNRVCVCDNKPPHKVVIMRKRRKTIPLI